MRKYEHNIGRYGLHDDTKVNGSHLVDFALAHDLVIGGTLYIKRYIREPGRPPMEMPSTRWIIY
jgi:hypothetical protein